MRYLVVLTALLVSCATTEKGWEKPGASQQDFIADRGECVSRAFVTPTAFQQSMILAGCMQSKGWTWVERPMQHTSSAPQDREGYCKDLAQRIAKTSDPSNTTYRYQFETCMPR